MYIKSPENIKAQIEFWYLKYYHLTYELVDGMGVFTIFDKMPSHKREYVLSKLNLNNDELAVLVLTIDNDEFVINTTRRFIRLSNDLTESIYYTDFKWHRGFRSIGLKHPESGKLISVKTDSYFAEFGLMINSGTMVYWKIPTGSAGFGFWNVTKKCELIGRKYVADK
jgi:hypothetical protein